MSTDPPAPDSSSNSAAVSGQDGALRLLDREPPAGYIHEWTERIAGERKAAESGTQSALVFRIGPEWLALPPGIFQEVAERCPAHSLPHRQDGVVKGIVNIRGELVVCVSLATVLGLASEPPAIREPGRRMYGLVLVANRAGNRLAFPVNEVHGVLRYQPGELRALPATLAESKVTYTLGLLPWGGRTVGCLDDELLFYTLNRSLA
ncbi:MAG: hypothetical protein JWM59_2774 [Verrucomicrobiales bacterium]|nr:hypothetical protein [Verrucomicrobiales bacterium]